MSLSWNLVMDESAAESAVPSFPSFYRQLPYGIGGAEIEALTSYVTRLADRHSIPATVLLRHARLCQSDGSGTTNNSPPHSMHHSLNGYGPKAQDFARALAAATGIPDLIKLTLIPWEGAFSRNGQGLLSDHRNWCPHCWIEDIANGRTPYVRLYWLIKCVSRCHKHKTPLQDTCPGCFSQQRVLPLIPRFRICGSCGADMIDHFGLADQGASPESGRSDPIPSPCVADESRTTREEADRQNWYARNVADLIRQTCAAGHGLKKGAANKSIIEIYDSGFNGSATALAHVTHLDKAAFSGWRSGKSCPQFHVFAELSYRLQLPLSSLLVSGDTELGFSAALIGGPKLSFTNRRLDTPEARARLGEQITRLASDPEPPCSLAELARRAGTSTATVRYRFPEEAHAVMAVGKRRREAAWAADAERRKREVAAACERMIAEGEYPTAKKLSARFGLVRSEFRKPRIQALLREYQACFGSDGPA